MNPVYEIGRLVAKACYDLWFAGEVAGVENIPAEGPFLLASNHASFLDPPLIGSNVPRHLCYFARKNLFKPGLPSWFLHRVNTIPVDRDGGSDVGAIKQIFKSLKQGRGILIFPEGTRSPDGNFLPPRPGTGMIACKSGVPVVPVRIFGSAAAYGRGMSIPRFQTPVSIAFGPPLLPQDYDPGQKEKKRYLEASIRIMTAIANLPGPPRAPLQ